MKEMEIAIVGAGIGGLTLALALHQRGYGFTIFERAATLGEVGAGLTLWPNATRVLYELGLGPVLDAISEEPVRQVVRHFATSEAIQYYPRAAMMRERYGAPLYQIHRRDLHDMLVAAVERVAPGSIRLSQDVVGVDPGSKRPRLEMADGTAIAADLVVGCDGIRSCVRSALFGQQAPRFTNIVAWRGLVSMADVPEPLQSDPAGLHIGPHRHFTHYTIRQRSTLNYLAIAEVEGWTEESWTIRSDISQVLEHFADFSPVVAATIAATPPDRCFKWGLFDREPQRRWSVGAVTLLGDAAHPMLPFLGQGAGMVIEDAMVLARALDDSTDIAEALARYERARGERTAYTMLQSRARAEYYHSDPREADERSLEMEVDLNEYDAMTVPV